MHLLKVINAYIHDFASALWLAALVVVWRLDGSAPSVQDSTALADMEVEWFWVGVVSLVVIVLTGVGRTLAYEQGAMGEEAEAGRKRLLIIKHIAGTLIYGAGTWAMYALAF